MIFTDRTVTVQKGTSSINDTIVLYRGDKEVEIRFTLNEGSPFRFGSGASPNIIEKTEAAYGQLIIKRPNDLPAVFSEVAPTNNGKIVFTITAEMIDEITEVGNYTFQIRLLDESRNSRATIPEVVNGIEIREPIATEDITTTNEVGEATVGYALTTAGTTEDAFDSQGNYNKTTWRTGDRITAAKLNKIENSIDSINKKANNIPTRTSQLENDSDYATITQVNQAIDNAQLGGGGSNINDTTASTTTTYSSNKIESIKENLSSQITGIENNIQNIGNPTDEQVKNAINEAIANGDIVAGGLTSTAQTLLINILRSSVFTSDQSANITLLQSELAKGNSGGSSGGGSETTRYTITNTLNNATTSNSTVLVDANSSYTATITVNEGYTLDTITVTMGGTDITRTAVSGTTITIASVTGNVVITVTTTAISSGGGSAGMVTDGLENYFDFRTATYNNEGAGGSTIISATQGNGSLYTWAKNMVTEQGDYGMIVTRSMMYNGTSVGTTTTSLGTSFTVIFKCYITTLGSPLFDNGYASLSNMAKLTYRPKYKTTGSTGNVDGVGLGRRLDSGYDTVTLIVDGNICKLYFGTTLMQTNDGSTISDFQGWYDQLPGIVMLSARGYFTQMAIYNKALSEVELVDMIDYLTTLEVK